MNMNESVFSITSEQAEILEGLNVKVWPAKANYPLKISILDHNDRLFYGSKAEFDEFVKELGKPLEEPEQPDEFQKITTGFVIQNFVNGRCVSQEFVVCGDDCDYEVNGEPLGMIPKYTYQEYEMIQPVGGRPNAKIGDIHWGWEVVGFIDPTENNPNGYVSLARGKDDIERGSISYDSWDMWVNKKW